jgi:hypothetical protein
MKPENLFVKYGGFWGPGWRIDSVDLMALEIKNL